MKKKYNKNLGLINQDILLLIFGLVLGVMFILYATADLKNSLISPVKTASQQLIQTQAANASDIEKNFNQFDNANINDVEPAKINSLFSNLK